MEMSEIKKQKDADLMKLLAEKREALRKFRFDAAGSRARTTKEGRDTRRDIARILTELTMRRDAATPESA